MLGRMIWFNDAKGHGFIRTEDGERLYVAAGDFATEPPSAGRCGGTEVSFERVADGGEPRAVEVMLASPADTRRARHRGHGGPGSVRRIG